MEDTNTIIRYENAKLIQDRCKKSNFGKLVG